MRTKRIPAEKKLNSGLQRLAKNTNQSWSRLSITKRTKEYEQRTFQKHSRAAPSAEIPFWNAWGIYSIPESHRIMCFTLSLNEAMLWVTASNDSRCKYCYTANIFTIVSGILFSLFHFQSYWLTGHRPVGYLHAYSGLYHDRRCWWDCI